MPIHGTLFTEFQETTAQEQFALQNKKLLKIQMGYGPVWAKSGSMVAYQGDVHFQNRGSGGLGRMVKSAMTGEGVSMMECTGQGELFVADGAADVQVFYLAGSDGGAHPAAMRFPPARPGCRPGDRVQAVSP